MNWNMFYLLDGELSGPEFCTTLSPVWTIFGYIIFAIQIVVPLLLIVSGMITMAKAVMEKDDKKIKEAQNLLIKKLIAAVITFLVIAAVKMIVPLVSNEDWEDCATCAMHPFGTMKDGKTKCGISKEPANYPKTEE